jgi:hypothetical protein
VGDGHGIAIRDCSGDFGKGQARIGVEELQEVAQPVLADRGGNLAQPVGVPRLERRYKSLSRPWVFGRGIGARRQGHGTFASKRAGAEATHAPEDAGHGTAERLLKGRMPKPGGGWCGVMPRPCKVQAATGERRQTAMRRLKYLQAARINCRLKLRNPQTKRQTGGTGR